MNNYKFHVGQPVMAKDTGLFGRVFKILPHQFVPGWLNWLIKPNYLVLMNYLTEDNQVKTIYKQSELMNYLELFSVSNINITKTKIMIIVSFLGIIINVFGVILYNEYLYSDIRIYLIALFMCLFGLIYFSYIYNTQEYVNKLNNKGAINVYKCADGHSTVTTNIDNGVIPMFITCHDGDCLEISVNTYYREYDQKLIPTYEWYRPFEDEYNELTAEEKECVDKGGLLLRKIKGAQNEEIYS